MISTRMMNLHPYVPGEQPKDRDYIKLNANENPYPVSGYVQEKIIDFVKNNPFKLSLYPDPDSNELKKAIATMLNQTGAVLSKANIENNIVTPNKNNKLPFEVTSDMIFVGNGSDEVLSFVFYSFFDSDIPLVLPEHTYSFYPVYSEFYNIKLNKIPLKNDWSLDTSCMIKNANKNNTSIIFANPNAPTGIALSVEQIKKMLDECPKDKVFVVDEAYADFSEESCIPLLKDYKNLIIVRTFSKSICGAGMRLGYLVSNPELINIMTTAKNSFNHFPVDAITQTAGIASCKDISYYCECAKKVVEERDSFIKFLKEKNWNVIDSKTNFVFAECPKMSGEEVYKKIKENGILVRHFNTKGIQNFVRITIGTKEQMNLLKSVIDIL